MMRRAILSGLLLLFVALSLDAQVYGKVYDEETGQPVSGVMVKLLKDGQTITFTTTKKDGSFNMPKATIPATLTFTHISYQPYDVVVSKSEEVIYFLKPTIRQLEDVVVEAPRIVQKGDTTTYHLGRFVSQRDATVSDALKRLPGVEIDKVGIVSYLGKPIDKLTIDGLDMLGKDYQGTLNSLKHESVSKVEIMERQQEVKLLQDLIGDEKIVMNLVLNRNARDKMNGKAQIGIGGDKNEVAYMGAANLLYFRPRFQINMEGAYGRNFDSDGQKLNYTIDSPFKSIESSPLLSALSDGLNPPIPQIDEQFFSRKESGKGVLNGIYQFNSTRTLRTKLNFDVANTRHDYGNDITFFTDSEGSVVLNESQVRTLEKVQQWGTEIRYIDNNNSYYLANELKYKGDWNRQRDQIERPPLQVTQEVDTKYHLIEDQLTYRKRIDDKVYSFAGDIWYQNIPLIGLTSNEIAQGFREEKIGGAIGTSFLFSMGRSWRLTFPIRALIGSDRINNKEQQYIFGEKRLSLTTTPTLSYFKAGEVELTFAIPLNLVLLNYNRIISGDNPRYNKLFVSPNLTFMYRFDPTWNVEGNLGYNKDVGSLMDLLDIPYYTSYRVSVQSAGELSERQEINFIGSLKYRKPMQELYGKIMLSGSYRKNNQLFGDNPNSAANHLVALLQDNIGYNLNAGADASKYFRKARTKLTAGISGYLSGFDSNRFGEMVKSQIFGLSPWISVQSELSKNFELKYNLSFSRSQLSYQSELLAPLHSLSQRLSVTYSPTSYFFITIEGEHLGKEVKVKEFDHVALINALAEYKTGKGIWKIALNNLLNQQQYRFTTYHATMSTSSWYQLRGFTGLLSYTFYF